MFDHGENECGDCENTPMLLGQDVDDGFANAAASADGCRVGGDGDESCSLLRRKSLPSSTSRCSLYSFDRQSENAASPTRCVLRPRFLEKNSNEGTFTEMADQQILPASSVFPKDKADYGGGVFYKRLAEDAENRNFDYVAETDYGDVAPQTAADWNSEYDDKYCRPHESSFMDEDRCECTCYRDGDDDDAKYTVDGGGGGEHSGGNSPLLPLSDCDSASTCTECDCAVDEQPLCTCRHEHPSVATTSLSSVAPLSLLSNVSGVGSSLFLRPVYSARMPCIATGVNPRLSGVSPYMPCHRMTSTSPSPGYSGKFCPSVSSIEWTDQRQRFLGRSSPPKVKQLLDARCTCSLGSNSSGMAPNSYSSAHLEAVLEITKQVTDKPSCPHSYSIFLVATTMASVAACRYKKTVLFPLSFHAFINKF